MEYTEMTETEVACSCVDNAGYRSALDSLYCAAVIINTSGYVLYYNPSAKRLLSECQISMAALVGELRKQVRPEKGIGRFMFAINDVRLICNVYPWEVEGKRLGSTLILHSAAQGNCSGPAMNHIEDTLSEMNAVLEVSYDGMMVSNGEGNITQVNSAAEKVLNISRRELLGSNIRHLIEVGILDDSAVLKVLETGKAASLMVQTMNKKKLLISAVPVLDQKGHVFSVMANLRDLSELYELQMELEQQRHMAEAYHTAFDKINNQLPGNIIATSRKMRRLLETIASIAHIDSTVVVTGESGVGKEVIVNHIYGTSDRSKMPIVKINCGAIPPNLFESEMFGYAEGAFTGAGKHGKAGFFEMANGGTLFLDEIGELRQDLQVKLLRVIQEGELTRVGGTKTIRVDVRIIAATNRNLWEEVQAGNFRQDLYYRLNVISMEIPPLRKRPEDILPLAFAFLEKFNKKYHRNKVIGYELGNVLRSLEWPGNIRELENLIENLVVLVQEEDVLQPYHMPERYKGSIAQDYSIIVNGVMPMKEAVDKVEEQLFKNVRQQYRTTREMAEALGINQSTVVRKLKHFKKKPELNRCIKASEKSPEND